MKFKKYLIALTAVLLIIAAFVVFKFGILQKKAPPAETASVQEEAVTEEAPEEALEVEIPLEQQQLIGVKTVTASIKSIKKTIRTVGKIEYDERRRATVNTKFEGWIEKLHVDYTGRPVKKGEPLAEIYSPELLATQQEYLNQLRWSKRNTDNPMLLQDAEALTRAAKERLRLWDITEEQIKNIEDTGKPLRTVTIYSPVGGYVLEKSAVSGMRVMPGERLFDIADLSSVWVIADIYEYELPLVKVGQTAKIGLSYIPGKTFSSKIDYIYPALSFDTKTAKVRLTLPNKGNILKPDMFADVEIAVDVGKRLTVSESAVLDTGVRKIVYVDKGDGYFEPREVETGMKADGLVEITKGISDGESVVSEANFLVDSEARLKGIVK